MSVPENPCTFLCSLLQVWALTRLGAQLDGPAAALLLQEVSKRLEVRAAAAS